jgi:hypothetical protein
MQPKIQEQRQQLFLRSGLQAQAKVGTFKGQ